MAYPIPENEPERVLAVESYQVAGSPPKVGYDDIAELAAEICDCPCLLGLARSLEQLQGELDQLEQRLQACHRSDPDSRRLESIPGLGPVASTALRASIGDGSQFRSGREFAAWVGLVPRQNSTGGKARLGRICKQGDGYLRWLLVAGAMAVIRHHRKKGASGNPWLDDLLARKPAKVAAVALANKNARIAWALLRSGERYRRPAPTLA